MSKKRSRTEGTEPLEERIAPRAFKDAKVVADKLPKKNTKGKWHDQYEKERGDTESLSGGDDDASGASGKEDEQEGAHDEESFEQIKAKIDRLCSQIMASPETKIHLLKTIRRYCDDNKNPEVYQLAITSMLYVLLDIIPDYYIRPLSESEQTQKVSKEVKELRAFEESILAIYSEFIKFCYGRALGSKGCSVALTVLLELFCKKSHFNFFTSDLVRYVIDAAFKKRLGEQVAEGLQRLFETDIHGKASLEALRELSNQMRDKGYASAVGALHPKIFDALMKVNMAQRTSEVSVGAMSSIADKDVINKQKRKLRHMSKQERKRARHDKEEAVKQLNLDLANTKEQRAQYTGEILKFLFRIYFGVLQTEQPRLLAIILPGLAKFAPKVRPEYLADLNAHLRKIVARTTTIAGMKETKQAKKPEMLSLPACIAVVQAILRIQRFNNIGTSTDMKFIYDFTYKLLHRPDIIDHLDVMGNILEGMFANQSALPINRVSAFIHRLSALIAVEPKTLMGSSTDENLASERAIIILTWMQMILTHHAAARCLLPERNEQCNTVYNSIIDPDFSDARNHTLPLQKLKTIWADDPFVMKQIRALNKE